VTLEQNGDKYQKEIRSGGGFISQSDLRVHFGLGKAEKAEKIVIRWPNGLLETLKDLEANRYYVVREGSGMDSKQTRNVNKMQIKTPGRVILRRVWKRAFRGAQQVNNSRGRNPGCRAESRDYRPQRGPHFQADTAASEVMRGSGEFLGADQSFARND